MHDACVTAPVARCRCVRCLQARLQASAAFARDRIAASRGPMAVRAESRYTIAARRTGKAGLAAGAKPQERRRPCRWWRCRSRIARSWRGAMRSSRTCAAWSAPSAVIADEDERRAYETDALTAYRAHAAGGRAAGLDRGGLARAALTATQNGIKVVPRGAGTSLSGGALPSEDAVVVGVVAHEPRARDRLRRTASPASRSASPTSASATRSQPRGFFYAPDPSSQLACTHRRQHRHELRRRALPQVRRHHQQRARRQDGADRRRRSSRSAAPISMRRATTCSASSSARRASSASSPRRRCASCARPRARGRCCSASTPARPPAQCVAAIIGAGIIPVAIEFMDQPGDPGLRGLRQGRLSARRRGAADHRGRGLGGGDRRPARRASPRSPSRFAPERSCASARAPSRAPPSGRAARRPSAPSAASPTTTAWTASSRSASWPRCWSPSPHICDGHGLRVANIFHAGDGNLHPLILYDANDPDAGRAGRGGGRRDPRSSASRSAAASPASTASASRSAT